MIGQGKGNRITIKDMEAIEKIKGYCCEVTQGQWEELVRVADDVGVYVGGPCSSKPMPDKFFIRYYNDYGLISVLEKIDRKVISFADFIAKLKGWNDDADRLFSSDNDKWQPKSGELVEVSDGYGQPWYKGEYIATSKGLHIAWTEGDDDSDVAYWNLIRPIRPTITRAEAEQQLGKRIID
jgi:hypothetical protein